MNSIILLFFVLHMENGMVDMRTAKFSTLAECETQRASFNNADMLARSFCATVTVNIPEKIERDEKAKEAMPKTSTRGQKEAFSCHPPQAFYAGQPCRKAGMILKEA